MHMRRIDVFTTAGGIFALSGGVCAGLGVYVATHSGSLVVDGDMSPQALACLFIGLGLLVSCFGVLLLRRYFKRLAVRHRLVQMGHALWATVVGVDIDDRIRVNGCPGCWLVCRDDGLRYPDFLAGPFMCSHEAHMMRGKKVLVYVDDASDEYFVDMKSIRS